MKCLATSSSTTTTLEKHLKDIVRIHSTTHAAPSTLINFLQVHSVIIHLSFLLITENSVTFSYIFEHNFSFFYCFFTCLLVFIRMPFYSFFPVSFFDFWLSCTLWDVQNFVVIFSLWFFKFYLSMFEFFSDSRCLRIDLLDFIVFINSFIILLHW